MSLRFHHKDTKSAKKHKGDREQFLLALGRPKRGIRLDDPLRLGDNFAPLRELLNRVAVKIHHQEHKEDRAMPRATSNPQLPHY